jgi:hypothetical protein
VKEKLDLRDQVNLTVSPVFGHDWQSASSHLSEREADDRALSITILIPPGNPKGALGEPKLACCPKQNAKTSDLETHFTHLDRLVLRRQPTKKLINTTIIAIGSDRCPHAPQEFGMTDDIQDATSVRDCSGQFKGVVATSRFLSGSYQRFDVGRVRENLELRISHDSPGTEDPSKLLSLHRIGNHRGTPLETELRQVGATAIVDGHDLASCFHGLKVPLSPLFRQGGW